MSRMHERDPPDGHTHSVGAFWKIFMRSATDFDLVLLGGCGFAGAGASAASAARAFSSWMRADTAEGVFRIAGDGTATADMTTAELVRWLS